MGKVKFVVFALSRAALSAVFVYAGFVKFCNPAAFYADIAAYRLLPEWAAYVCAYFLPPFEVVLGVGVLVPRYLKVSSALIAVLNVAFIIALASAWARGLDISCGCFGAGASVGAPDYALLIARDAVFAGLGAVIFRLSGGLGCPPQNRSRARARRIPGKGPGNPEEAGFLKEP